MTDEQVRDVLFMMGSEYELDPTNEETVEYLKEMQAMGFVKIVDRIAYKTDKGRKALINIAHDLNK